MIAERYHLLVCILISESLKGSESFPELILLGWNWLGEGEGESSWSFAQLKHLRIRLGKLSLKKKHEESIQLSVSLVVLVHFLLGVKIHSEESDDDDGGLGYKSTTQRPVSTEMTPGNFKFQINCEAHFGAEEMDSQLLLASLSLLHSTSASVHCFSPPVDDGRRARCAELIELYCFLFLFYKENRKVPGCSICIKKLERLSVWFQNPICNFWGHMKKSYIKTMILQILVT